MLPIVLQMFLHRLDYLSDKQARAKDEMERQILAKQVQETEREISEIK